jgi:uncharacterized protein YggL (DUF469 family)
MKSIFDQYKLVNEGTLSQAQFLRNVKMALPKFISNITTFNDAVKILKNKGIITEARLQEAMGESLAEETIDELNNMVSAGKLTQEQANQIDDYLNDNNYEVFESGDFFDPLEVIEYALKQLQMNISLNEAKESSTEYGMPNEWCNPQEYNLGMRYELDKGTDEEKADKIVKKNLADNVSYYSQLHLAGYDESAMAKDRKKRTDLPVEVKKDNFVDAVNGVKKVKMDKLTEDELKVLIGNILAESAEQKKTDLTESIEDNIAQMVNDKSSKYTFYNSKHKADMQRIFRMSAIRQILKNPNLTDEDRQKLETELEANKPEPAKTISSPGPGSVELYRLGQKGNYTGD